MRIFCASIVRNWLMTKASCTTSMRLASCLSSAVVSAVNLSRMMDTNRLPRTQFASKKYEKK